MFVHLLSLETDGGAASGMKVLALLPLLLLLLHLLILLLLLFLILPTATAMDIKNQLRLSITSVWLLALHTILHTNKVSDKRTTRNNANANRQYRLPPQ